MTCAELERWLDEGLLEGDALGRARAHAAGCPSCAAALRAATEIESLLAATAAVAAPAGFADRVMARVAIANRTLARAPASPPATLPWWVRAAGQPASALAALVAGLVLWRQDALWSAARSLTALLARATARVASAAPPTLPPPFDRPEIVLALCLAVLPAAAWGSWALFGWTERRTRGSIGRPALPVAR